MSTQEQRERFEAEYRKHFPMTTSIRPDRFDRDEFGDYAQTITHVAWTLFRYAEAAAIERCAKVVKDMHKRISHPVTIGQERWDAGNNTLNNAEAAIRALLKTDGGEG